MLQEIGFCQKIRFLKERKITYRTPKKAMRFETVHQSGFKPLQRGKRF